MGCSPSMVSPAEQAGYLPGLASRVLQSHFECHQGEIAVITRGRPFLRRNEKDFEIEGVTGITSEEAFDFTFARGDCLGGDFLAVDENADLSSAGILRAEGGLGETGDGAGGPETRFQSRRYPAIAKGSRGCSFLNGVAGD